MRGAERACGRRVCGHASRTKARTQVLPYKENAPSVPETCARRRLDEQTRYDDTPRFSPQRARISPPFLSHLGIDDVRTPARVGGSVYVRDSRALMPPAYVSAPAWTSEGTAARPGTRPGGGTRGARYLPENHCRDSYCTHYLQSALLPTGYYLLNDYSMTSPACWIMGGVDRGLAEGDCSITRTPRTQKHSRWAGAAAGRTHIGVVDAIRSLGYPPRHVLLLAVH
ncbi:hypothetical protein DFH11DRAFT_1129287 [Phellopilus nigrolimitatus]|nr:hypothetical protein DFH11DRAFT_1129287 [Phellopilus nigrolimitatus]